jgi:flagellar basal body-associated protein FliL
MVIHFVIIVVVVAVVVVVVITTSLHLATSDGGNGRMEGEKILQARKKNEEMYYNE